jgi:hypothetical protein
MEGAMDDQLQNHNVDNDLQPRLEFQNGADAAGLWFAAAALIAVLAAGIIIYRAGNREIRTAAIDGGPASSLITPPPMLPSR